MDAVVVDRDEHVEPLGAAGLHRAGKADIGQCLADRLGGADRHRERIGFWWVEVEHEVGDPIRPIDAHQGGVILDRTLVGEPQQRPAVVAQRVRHVPLRRLGPPAHRAHPVGRVLRHVLLHEGFLAAMDADDRQRPVLEHGKDPVADGVEVVHEVTLRRTGAIEKGCVQVRQRDAIAGFVVGLRGHREPDANTRSLERLAICRMARNLHRPPSSDRASQTREPMR